MTNRCRLLFLPLFLIIACLLCMPVLAEETYIINDKEIRYDLVEWPGEGNCWKYANDMYRQIWDVAFDNTFSGSETDGSNLLKQLSDEERLCTPENTEIFVKSAVPGAVIRLTNALSTDDLFESDGLQADGTYGHNLIVAKIYDEGFVAFESLSSGTRERFYTWESFCDTWGGVEYTAPSHYKYFKYVKWPHANVLTVDSSNSLESPWAAFLAVFIGCSLLTGAICVLFIVWKKKHKNTISADNRFDLRCLQLFLGSMPFLLGGFFAWGSAVAAVVLILMLFRLFMMERFQIHGTGVLLAFAILVFSYLISAFWAVDRGLAVFGFVKFLPIPLYILVLQQYPVDFRKTILNVVPWSGGIMTILSLVLCFIPFCRELILIDERLAGFFQYPNTYALFLLLGLIILGADQNMRNAVKIVLSIVLIAGIVLSGSRTVFVLTAVIMILQQMLRQSWKKRLRGILAIGAVALIVFLAANYFGNSVFERYLHISLKSSTFLGRFLYFVDAIPVILRHPFGLGYMGYYYSQGSFQTGVYSVMYVHNDFLQMLLDVGWIPALLVTVVLIRQLFMKNREAYERLLLLAILAHSMFDFSLQFLSIWLVLATVLYGGREWIVLHCKARVVLTTIGAVFSGAVIALGTASFLETYFSSETVLNYYPNDTHALIEQLTKSENASDMNYYAERILELDKKVSVAHSAKAKVAFQSGFIDEMIQEKQQAISCARFSEAEYQDYFDMLKYSVSLYESQNDFDSANYCKLLIFQIEDQMQAVLDSANSVAWEINDKPELQLTEEQIEYLDSLR